MTADPEFDDAFRRHYPAVLRYALRRTDPASARDIASDVFLTAWRHRETSSAIELPWLLAVARRVVANQRRSKSRAHALVLRIEQQPSESIADPADHVVTRDELARALAALSSDDQELLALIAWDGLTVGAAATVLGCSPATASMRLTRARRRLRRHLRHDANELDSAPQPTNPGVPDA